MKTLSAELIAIVATGIALAGLQVVGQHRLEDRLLAVEKEQARAGVILERVEKEQARVGAILERVEMEQVRFRALHEGVEFTTYTHDDRPNHE